MQSHDQKIARGKFHIYPTIIALSIFLCLSAVSYGQSIDAQKIVSKTVDLRDDVKLEVVKQERLPEDAVEHITPGKIGVIQRQIENIELMGLHEIESQEETIGSLAEIPESEKEGAVVTGSADFAHGSRLAGVTRLWYLMYPALTP